MPNKDQIKIAEVSAISYRDTQTCTVYEVLFSSQTQTYVHFGIFKCRFLVYCFTRNSMELAYLAYFQRHQQKKLGKNNNIRQNGKNENIHQQVFCKSTHY